MQSGIVDGSAPLPALESGEEGRQGVTLALLIGTVLGLRALAAAQTAVLTPDGVTFIEIARLFTDGDPQAALAYKYHPLTSFLCAMVRGVTGDYEMAGQIVSVVFSTLAVVPLFHLTRRIAGSRASVAAGLLYAFLPYGLLLGAEILSEGVFLFFFLSALALFHLGLTRGRWAPTAVAGLCTGLAYLTRPEAVGLGAAFFAFALVRAFRDRRPGALGHFGIFAFSALLIACPYLIHVHEATGVWGLTKKKALSHLVNPGSPGTGSMAGKAFSDLGAVVNALFRAGNGVVLLLSALAVLLPAGRRERFWRRDLFFLLPVLAWMGMGFFLVFSHGYLSRRHLLPASAALLPLAGAGLPVLLESLSGLTERLLPRFERKGVYRVFFVFAVVALALSAIPAARPRRVDKLFEKELGENIQERIGGGRRIVSTLPRVPYFAKGWSIEFPPLGGPEEVRAYIQEQRAGFLLVDLEDPLLPRFHGGFLDRFDPPSARDGFFAPQGYRLLSRWNLPGRRRALRIRLYEVVASSEERR